MIIYWKAIVLRTTNSSKDKFNSNYQKQTWGGPIENISCKVHTQQR